MHQTAAPLQQDTRDHRPSAMSREEARREDAFWQRTYWQERYYEDGYEYEDYAPAYCVGYAGCVQYGGRFEDAQRCLAAKWERIRGDSRLPFAQALPAIRAAWQRMARLRQRQLQAAANEAAFADRPHAEPSGAARTFSRTVPAPEAAAAAAG